MAWLANSNERSPPLFTVWLQLPHLAHSIVDSDVSGVTANFDVWLFFSHREVQACEAVVWDVASFQPF